MGISMRLVFAIMERSILKMEKIVADDIMAMQ